MNRHLTTLALVATIPLAGCSSNPKYACGLPEGIGCQPVSTVYERAVTGTLPETHATPTKTNTSANTDAQALEAVPAEGTVVDIKIATVAPGDAVLTRPRVQRVWIRRFEDKDGDLHDETYLYLRLDAGQWRLAP